MWTKNEFWLIISDFYRLIELTYLSPSTERIQRIHIRIRKRIWVKIRWDHIVKITHILVIQIHRRQILVWIIQILFIFIFNLAIHYHSTEYRQKAIKAKKCPKILHIWSGLIRINQDFLGFILNYPEFYMLFGMGVIALSFIHVVFCTWNSPL